MKAQAAGYRRGVQDPEPSRELPDDVFVAATDWLWLGRTLGELVEPLFVERRLEAWVFAPADVPDEDLRTYADATRSTDASAAWWDRTVQQHTERMKREVERVVDDVIRRLN